ncbi:RagB/SusD family nutrient uptake outer membrane protein [Mesoflavibacter zeaxanthinifaciens]|uniref:RagB/SusD family nutrient uptake outer membrane protein n=1 Tax=Mesoflavibacter zeaxanthinifaciens TaxID=393060 RepID=UPI003A8DF548
MNIILKYASKYLVILLTIIQMFNCESYIEVELPDSQLVGETVFNDLDTAEAAVTNIYSELSNNVLVCGNNKGISILLGSYADELQTYNTGISEFIFYQNNLSSFNSNVASLWDGSYQLIYAANAIIEGLDHSYTISEYDKVRLKGEALFVRAFMHFYLAHLFGDIPYATSTDYNVNSVLGRTPIAEVRALLITDLEAAKQYLDEGPINPLKLRPSVHAVNTLLARIYLYDGDWAAAEAVANSVISFDGLNMETSLDAVFLKTSSGTIWQVMREEGLPTHEAQSFIFTLSPPPNRALSSSIIADFELGDLRKVHWTGYVEEGGDVWYYPYKYKQFVTEAESQEYSIVFRIEELYLIRAEARVHLGDLEGAKSDINKIRNRASLSNTSAETEQELLDAIIQERRIEFFSELGHRFFDLKRSGLIDTILPLDKPGWDGTDILLPIPDSELLLNPNLLPQNPGY